MIEPETAMLWVVGVALVSLLPVVTFKGRAPRLAFLAIAGINTAGFAAFFVAVTHDVQSIALFGALAMVGLVTFVLAVVGIVAALARVLAWSVRRLRHAA